MCCALSSTVSFKRSYFNKFIASTTNKTLQYTPYINQMQMSLSCYCDQQEKMIHIWKTLSNLIEQHGVQKNRSLLVHYV